MIKRDVAKRMSAALKAWTARSCTITFGKSMCQWLPNIAAKLIRHSRAIYGRVTEEDIDSYKVKYRFCDAEKEDLLEFYNNNGGDLTNILEFIPYSDEQDLERYACWFSLQIQVDAIKCTNKFKPWLKTDVNAEQQQQLWEQGKAKLQKVLSFFLWNTHFFITRT